MSQKKIDHQPQKKAFQGLLEQIKLEESINIMLSDEERENRKQVAKENSVGQIIIKLNLKQKISKYSQ